MTMIKSHGDDGFASYSQVLLGVPVPSFPCRGGPQSCAQHLAKDMHKVLLGCQEFRTSIAEEWKL